MREEERESNPCLAACRTQYMGTFYLRCSRVIEVEPRRTPVGVYTLVECSSDLMRRATISRSCSWNRIHCDSSSILHLTILTEFFSVIFYSIIIFICRVRLQLLPKHSVTVSQFQPKPKPKLKKRNSIKAICINMTIILLYTFIILLYIFSL